MKKSKVSFFRYYRPLDQATGYPDSSKGVTFYIRISYKKRWIRVSCSVCDGDNFSKVSGKFLACVRYDEGEYIQFDLDDFACSGESVMEYLQVEAAQGWFPKMWSAAAKQLKMRVK